MPVLTESLKECKPKWFFSRQSIKGGKALWWMLWSHAHPFVPCQRVHLRWTVTIMHAARTLQAPAQASPTSGCAQVHAHLQVAPKQWMVGAGG